MRTIDKILYHSFTLPFYRQIAGALVFLFFLLFGSQRDLRSALLFHYSLIISIIQTPLVLCIWMIISLLYTIKCASFFAGCMQKESYNFLHILNILDLRIRFYHLTITAISFLLPVLVYNGIVFIIALYVKNYASATVLFLVSVIITLFTTQYFIFLIRKPVKTFASRWKFPYKINMVKNLGAFLLSFMFLKQFRALLLVKLLSFLALYYFVRHDGSVFEERMLWLIFMLTIMAHAVIIYKNFYFLENEMEFYRNLPLSNVKILLSLFLVYAIICLPEWWALRALAFMHGNWYDYVCMVIAGPSLLLLLHTLLYTDNLNMEGFLYLLFGVWLVFFFFSFSENKWLVPCIALLGATIVFFTSFRHYQKKPEI